MISVVDFEAARPQLTAIAFRVLGSIHDAEDAVQTTWLRADRADLDEITSVPAWLTTVITRVCLDDLRTRQRRREEPLLADMIPAEDVAADEQYLRRENVSRALMVLLDRLTPPQRIAYVLHDLFSIPFDQVADVLNTTTANAKKHASRARRRVEQAAPTETQSTADRAVVEAFLAAATGGDLHQMIDLMNEDCVRVADASLLPPGTASVVAGAQAVAHETVQFIDRIRSSTPMTVNGRIAEVIAPGGHLLAITDIYTRENRIERIAITRASADMDLTIRPSTTS